MTEFVTREEYQKFRRLVIKKLQKLEALIGDAYEEIAKSESAESELVDEAIKKAERAQRTANRLKKEFDKEFGEE